MGRWLTSLLLLVLLALAVPATARSAYPGANGRIVVARYGGGLFTTDATGHDAKVLTYGATDFGPVYAPHGHRIAFERADDIWIVPARGGDPVRLTTASSWEGQPTWSPDGSHIAFVSNRGGAWRIYTLRSTRPYGKAVPVAAADDACTEEQPTWGVNGLIAFVRIACYSGQGAGDWSIAAVVPGESRIRTLVPSC